MEAALPYLTADLPAVPLVARARLDDFRVEELPAYPCSGSGDHVHFELEKRGLSTQDAVRRVARALGVAPREVGVAGLKDARGVTRQRLSIEHVDPARVAALELDGLRVLGVARHGNKLRRGHLLGNRFVLGLRGTAAGRVEEVRAVLERLAEAGVPNYFGPQRFGLRGDNWRVGAALLRGDHAEAAALIAGRPAEGDPERVRRARECFEAGDFQGAARAWPPRFRSAVRIARAMHRTGGDARKALRAAEGDELRFCVSAFQSHLFNRVVAARLEQGTLDTLLEGDLAWRHAGGAVFRVERPADEAPRAALFELSPSGPLFGRRMTWPAGAPEALERGVLAAAGVEPAAFEARGRVQWKGARRPLRVPLADLALEAGADDGGPVLSVTFALPAGSYATAVLREVAKDA